MLRVKLIRLLRDIHQQDVAAAVGIPKPILSEIENFVRNPKPAQLHALANFYDVPAACLLDHVVDPMASELAKGDMPFAGTRSRYRLKAERAKS